MPARSTILARQTHCLTWGDDGHLYASEDTGERRTYCDCGAIRIDRADTLILHPDDNPPF